MKIIKFIPTGKAISDFEISDYVDGIQASKEGEFRISTNLIIDEIRARIKEGRIDIHDVQIWVMGDDGLLKPFDVDKDGNAREWQKSQDVNSNILMRLI